MAIGYLQTTTPEIANASANISSGFADMTGLTGPVILVLWAVVIMGTVSAARNSDYFERLVDAFGMLAVSFYYAVHGLAAVTALAVLSAPVYWLSTADGSTQAAVGKYALYAVGGYAALTVVGYAFKHKLVNPIMENADEHDLLPEPEEDAEEVAD